jgi:hypothetical protein
MLMNFFQILLSSTGKEKKTEERRKRQPTSIFDHLNPLGKGQAFVKLVFYTSNCGIGRELGCSVVVEGPCNLTVGGRYRRFMINVLLLCP